MNTTKDAFGFLLMPGFPSMAVSSAVDVLALANYVSQQTLYQWYSLSDSESPVRGMNGFRITPDHTIDNVPAISTAVVCAGICGKNQTSTHLSAWLRQFYAQGGQVGAISTGSWVLAEAGMLNSRRCTIHWEDMVAFREMYPEMNVTAEIFEVDGRVFTCSGGAAVVDLFLSFVATRHGIELAHEVAAQLVYQNTRSTDERQREKLSVRLGITHQRLSSAIELMEKHIETPLSITEISRLIGISERQLERLFRKKLGQTPKCFYRLLRLQRAQSLLKGTSRPVYEVAYATGFSTSSYFARCYQQHFGHLPGQHRDSTPSNGATNIEKTG